MSDFAAAVRLALDMIVDFDPALLSIVALSLSISLTAAIVAGAAGCLAGAVLAVYRFPGRRLLIVVANSLLGLPPVVVGLAAYLLLTRNGPLGSWGLLFTPTAMVIVQTVLAIPIVTAISHRALEEVWARYGDEFRIAGATRLRAIPQLLLIGKAQLLTALLSGLGRTISEVGGIIIVGGNIAGVTRTMTTSIVLETSKGNLPLALALGIILITISLVLNGAAFALSERKTRS
ncbi:MAG TPA: ABC transporter permease [Stellaceae bacterium]|nr:ABC transporter permease [Stellaceae bacterium]